jgi:hypothetical protein
MYLHPFSREATCKSPLLGVYALGVVGAVVSRRAFGSGDQSWGR